MLCLRQAGGGGRLSLRGRSRKSAPRLVSTFSMEVVGCFETLFFVPFLPLQPRSPRPRPRSTFLYLYVSTTETVRTNGVAKVTPNNTDHKVTCKNIGRTRKGEEGGGDSMAVSSVTVLGGGGFSGEGPREEGFRGLDGTKGRKGGRPCGGRRTSKARDRERRRDRGKGRGIPGFKRGKDGEGQDRHRP